MTPLGLTESIAKTTRWSKRKAKLTPSHPRRPVITVAFKCLQWAIDTLPMGHSPALNCSYTQFQTSDRRSARGSFRSGIIEGIL